MSRLDRMVSTVRGKLTLALILEAWAWTALFFGVTVWLAIIAQKVMDRRLQHAGMLFWIGAGISVLVAVIYGMIRRPGEGVAAAVIDQKLGLKERFSTALYARQSSDPFAHAVVQDAEFAAENTSIEKRFPLQFPKNSAWAIAPFVAALLTSWLLPTFHADAEIPKQQTAKAPTTLPTAAEKKMAEHMAAIEKAAPLLTTNEEVRKANDELNKALQTTEGDEQHNTRSQLAALQDYKKALKDELNTNEKYQTVLNSKAELSTIESAKDESTPIGKAQNELKAGNLDAAMKDLNKAVNDFNNMSADQQQKAVEQAANLADALAKAANDPKTAQKMAQQLMQMGATQSQAQQMSSLMQKAAAGDKQAAQQLQQIAQQAAQQMNNGQGPTQQQQQQMQSLMSKAQSLANSQAQAKMLSSSAQQLSQAMSQSQSQSQAGQKSSSGQQQNGQTPNSQKQNGQQQSGQQGQQNQPGQGQQPSSGQMQAAQQSMQQTMSQMSAQAKDAQAMQQAVDAAADAAADAASGLSPGDSQQAGNPQGNPPPQGGANPPGGNKPGQGNQGRGGNGVMPIAQAPFTVKEEIDPSQANDKGKLLASRYVKAPNEKGQSTAGIRDAEAAGEKQSADDIDSDHVPREAQQAEKDYFNALQQAGN